VGLWYVQPFLLPHLGAGLWQGIGGLALLVVSGFVVYAAVALFIGAATLTEIRAALSR